MILVGLAAVVLSPLIIAIILICTLLSRHIFANLVYLSILSVVTFNSIISESNPILRNYCLLILAIHALFTFIRISLLCIYRRTRTFHRLCLQFMINTIQISLLYTLQSHLTEDQKHVQTQDITSLNTLCTYSYSIIAILCLSEFWIRSGPNKLEQIENEILKLVIYKNKHATQENDKFAEIDSTLKIERDYKGNLSFLHCYTKASKQPLVILHGYVVGKCVFAIAIKWLSRYFHVYLIDAPGNGLSKPVWLPWIYPNWSANTDYYDKWTADQLEKWRLSVFARDEKIHLLGHSTGSYMCSVYALYYPQTLQHLILCSPVCLLTEKEYLSTSGLLKIDRAPYGLGAGVLSQYTWGYMTWHDFVRGLGVFGPYIFINALRKTQKHHTKYGGLDKNLWDEMSELWFRYTYDLHAQPKSYEDLLFAYMTPWCWPRNALLTRLKQKLQCNLLLLYADDEQSFCDSHGGKMLINQLREQKDWNYKAEMEIIRDSTHQMFLNQPVRCCKAILKHLLIEGD